MIISKMLENRYLANADHVLGQFFGDISTVGKVVTRKRLAEPISERVHWRCPKMLCGYRLSFTHRRSWKARRRLLDREVDIVPVTLTKGRRQGASSKEVFLQVWYQDVEELRRRVVDPSAFVVVLARAKDDRKMPPDVDEFVGIFRVVPTGIVLSENSIETKVLERVRA
jgi:hypothetical protein